MKKSSWFIIAIVLAVGAIGVLGYSLIEGWSLSDSIYMTLITLTTTGYQETHPLSHDGRVFTMFLLVLGMGTVAYSVGQLMQDLLSIDFKERRRRKMQKQIANLKDHVVLCGFGRMGKVVSKELAEKDVPFVVIENSKQALKDLVETDYYWIEGDATLDEALIQANIKDAKTLASMVDSDSNNLYISLAAKSLNPSLFVIVRANDESARQKITRAGADKVVLPITVSGIRVAQTIVNPVIEDLLDIEGVDLEHEQRVQMAEIEIKKDSHLCGKNLMNCGLKTEGFMVVGIRHEDGKFVFAPSAKYVFKEGDIIVSLTTPETQEELLRAQEVA